MVPGVHEIVWLRQGEVNRKLGYLPDVPLVRAPCVPNDIKTRENDIEVDALELNANAVCCIFLSPC